MDTVSKMKTLQYKDQKEIVPLIMSFRSTLYFLVIVDVNGFG